MRISRFWIRYGNKLTILAVLLGVCWVFYLYSTEPNPAAILNAQKISGWLEYGLQETLALHEVHARVDLEDKTQIVVSGNVTNKTDVDRIKSLLDKWSMDSIHVVVDVAIRREDNSHSAGPD